MKKRVLFCSELSLNKSGYSKISLELLRKLHETGKYEIAELATYCRYDEHRICLLPWKVYPVNPADNDEAGKVAYNQPLGQFGAWIFEKTCLDFLPDVVIDDRDCAWMSTFEVTSPFRPYYSLLWMPAVDADPQMDDWINQYNLTDGLLGYSNFALKTLEKHMGKSKLYGLGYGSNMDTFKPLNKDELRDKYGLSRDINLIGMVARNQLRKLYPDLFETFRLFLDKAPKELANKTFLHIHTGYPDQGWDIPRIIKENNLSHKTYFTYVCYACGDSRISKWNDYYIPCRRCKNPQSVAFTGPNYGVTDKTLCEIYNLYDVYIQLATCLPAGQQVLSNTGWKNIEEIRVDDTVFTHKNRWKKVSKLFKSYSSDIYSIKAWGIPDALEITGNHPIFAISKNKVKFRENISLREHIGDTKRLNKPHPEPNFVNTEDLQKGDLIGYPINDEITETNSIDLAKYVTERDTVYDNLIKIKYGKSYDRFIKVDEEFCEFIGLFVADGSSSGCVSITSNIKDEYNANFSEKYLKKITGTSSRLKCKNKAATTVYSSGKLYARCLRDLCKVNEFKQLPDFCEKLHPNLQKLILKGLFLGDGHFREDRNVSMYSTTSTKLKEQLMMILRRLRIDFNCNKRYRKGNRKPQYSFEVYGNILAGEFILNRGHGCNFYKDNYHFIQIKKITKQDKNEEVFNFEVEEDNSYVTKLGSVHNCEGLGIPIVEAGSCGVPVCLMPYSAMEDFVTTILAHPLPIAKSVTENGTHREWAYPDNDKFADELVKILSRPKEELREWGLKTRELCKENYDWNKIVKNWEYAIDNVKPAKRKWDAPRINMDRPQPNHQEDYLFVKQCIENVGLSPHLANGYLYNIFMRNLANKQFQEGNTIKRYDRQNVLDHCVGIRNNVIHWENERCQKFSI